MNELTEAEINEWTSRSLKRGICGIVNCFNKPTSQCPKCLNYYCIEHFKTHFHLVEDIDMEYQSLTDERLM